MSVPVARRQLLARKGRTIAGVCGIATALVLILTLNAIMAGMERQITAFIDHSHPDVIVAQAGVDTIHMSESTLPRRDANLIAALPGVTRVRPIGLVTTTVERGRKRGLVYLVGEEQRGSTIPTVAGTAPGPHQIVIDRTLASSLGALLGSRVQALGMTFRSRARSRRPPRTPTR